MNTKNLEKLFKYLREGYVIHPKEEFVKLADKEFSLLVSAEFWSNWVYPEGANPEEIQNELSDYHTFLKEASVVYDHVTKGRISKPNAKAFEVIVQFENLWAEKDEYK